jgi:entry exclusion lipoprotein TrbK
LTSLAVAAIAVIVSACSRNTATAEMPTVNDNNCNAKKIAKIGGKDAREQFASLCLRRGEFKPSQKREW